MKKLLVSQRVIFDKKTKIYRDALDQQLVNFFYKNNFILIPIPNLNISEKKLKIFIYDLFNMSKIHGIVLSGGNDINEYRSRDLLEKCLLDISQKKKRLKVMLLQDMKFLMKKIKIKNQLIVFIIGQL